MDPITLALLGAGAAKAIGGVAAGIGTARAGKAQMLTPAQQKELADLERRQREGRLGLTGGERGALQSQFIAKQAGAQREQEALALQQAAARGLSGAVSGREVFLQEQAQAAAERAAKQEQNAAVAAASQMEKATEEARIDALRAQQRAAEALRAQGIAQAVSGGLISAGDTGLQLAQATATAAAEAKRTEDLLSMYNQNVPVFRVGGSLVPPPPKF